MFLSQKFQTWMIISTYFQFGTTFDDIVENSRPICCEYIMVKVKSSALRKHLEIITIWA